MEPTDLNRRAFDAVHGQRGGARGGLPPIVKLTLGDLSEKRVLHLSCGTGETSAALAEQGAVVTAVDASEEQLDAARERWPRILWIRAEPQALPPELRRGRFDLAYSPEGVLAQLGDLDAWAAELAAALHPRGELLMFEEHPIADCVDGLLRWQLDYFRDGAPRLGSVVTALARAGFTVEALEEYPGDTAQRRHDRRVPGSFLLYALRRG